MDESDINLFQASNNIDVLETEEEDLTDDLGSENGNSVRREKDGANHFQLLKQPISAVSTAANALNACFKTNSSEGSESLFDSQEDGENHRSFQSSEDIELREQKHVSRPPPASCFDSFCKAEFDFRELSNSQEDKQSNGNVSKTAKSNLEEDFGAVRPRSSSPATGSVYHDIAASSWDSLTFKDEDKTFKNNSTLDRNGSITQDELDNLIFPDVPQNDPDSSDEMSIDGGSKSNASTSTLSKSYLSSSVSASVDIPNLNQDGYHLIPKYEPNRRGFGWPIDKLPLTGACTFEEPTKWKMLEKIGYGASGQCFHGISNNGTEFCVKKCKYYMEEVKALYLAAKEIHSKGISGGANKIVSFYGATYYNHNVCIFMEYMKEGTVNKAIYEAQTLNKDGLDKIDCVHYLQDVLLALEFLHSKGILHNDVKADNVLLDASKLQAKLCDFGKATAIDMHNSPSKDVWSAGCFLLEMLGKKYISALMSGFCKKANVLEQLPADVDHNTRHVLSMCFTKNRNQCTATYVLKCEFFNLDAN